VICAFPSKEPLRNLPRAVEFGSGRRQLRTFGCTWPRLLLQGKDYIPTFLVHDHDFYPSLSSRSSVVFSRRFQRCHHVIGILSDRFSCCLAFRRMDDVRSPDSIRETLSAHSSQQTTLLLLWQHVGWCWCWEICIFPKIPPSPVGCVGGASGIININTGGSGSRISM